MLINDSDYLNIITKIKDRIKTAQHNVILNANSEMILLYWNIGKVIEENSSWGNKFVENLARDIKFDFPNAKGYSVRNLKYMARFASMYTLEFVQQVVAQIPWGHNIAIMEQIKDKREREWYIGKTIENGWSRNVLVHQIELKLYERQSLADKTTNFMSILPKPQNELALETLKDPYVFDFVETRENIVERDIENELTANITKLLLELGTGFAFLGNQYHLQVGNKDFYLDLLFYNLNLRCYVVIELKTGEFMPEHAGKLNFYLSAVDDILKRDTDNPSIGILLCKSKDRLIAEYSLKDMTKPIGISEYKLLSRLPKELENTLPSVEDLENRIR